ncbi:hypothetical protein ColTof4_07411 [Colletotrichum tofieldiae]|nr:hypothetical protein ColTof4_07411 [Colletotrichum tofieldiae]
MPKGTTAIAALRMQQHHLECGWKIHGEIHIGSVCLGTHSYPAVAILGGWLTTTSSAAGFLTRV